METKFSALVTYVQPHYLDLKKIFDCAHREYNKAAFTPIERCSEVSRETREVSFVYVHLKRGSILEEVFAEMELRSLRPALYEEGLAFATKYPDEQRSFPIVVLGSVCRLSRENLYVACLDQFQSARMLYLEGIAEGWGDGCRFLAVRKGE